MRILLAIFLLPVLSGCYSALQPDPVAPQPAAIAPGQVLAPFNVAQVQNDVPFGAVLGRQVGALDCAWPWHEVRAGEDGTMPRNRDIRRRITSRLEASGLPVIDSDVLFPGSAPPARLQLGARLLDVALRLCGDVDVLFFNDDGDNGDGHVVIEWALYDPAAGRIIWEAQTEGTGRLREDIKLAARLITLRAIEAATAELAARPDFIEALSGAANAGPPDTGISLQTTGHGAPAQARVRLLDNDGENAGAGIVIDNAGRILAVPEDPDASPELRLQLASGDMVAGLVLRRDSATGLVLAAMENASGIAPVALSDAGPATGKAIRIPDAAGPVTGIVAGRAHDLWLADLMRTTTLAPGTGIFDADGALLGIIVAGPGPRAGLVHFIALADALEILGARTPAGTGD